MGERSLQNIKAILIDIDDTLLDFTSCSKLAMAHAKRVFGYDLPDDAYEVFKRINNGLWLRIERQELTMEELHQIRWKTIFEELGHPEYDGPGFEDVFFADLTHLAEPVSGAYETLRYLAGKYKLYAASNAAHNQQRNRLAKANLAQFFTDLFVSEEIGASKPTTAFFDVCLSRMGGVTKEEVALIGDSITADISGGNAYGLATIWYNHNRHADPTEPERMPHYKVDSLTEIKQLL